MRKAISRPCLLYPLYPRQRPQHGRLPRGRASSCVGASLMRLTTSSLTFTPCRTSGMCPLRSEITVKRSLSRAEWSSQESIGSDGAESFRINGPAGNCRAITFAEVCVALTIAQPPLLCLARQSPELTPLPLLSTPIGTHAELLKFL